MSWCEIHLKTAYINLIARLLLAIAILSLSSMGLIAQDETPHTPLPTASPTQPPIIETTAEQTPPSQTPTPPALTQTPVPTNSPSPEPTATIESPTQEPELTQEATAEIALPTLTATPEAELTASTPTVAAVTAVTATATPLPLTAETTSDTMPTSTSTTLAETNTPTPSTITPTATVGGVALVFVQGNVVYQGERESHAEIEIHILDEALNLLSVAHTDDAGNYRIAAPADAFYWLVADAPNFSRWVMPITPGDPLPQWTLPGGDLDGDGCIGALDMQLMQPYVNTDNPDVDLNQDGIVDVSDFTMLASNYDPACLPPSPTPTPTATVITATPSPAFTEAAAEHASPTVTVMQTQSTATPEPEITEAVEVTETLDAPTPEPEITETLDAPTPEPEVTETLDTPTLQPEITVEQTADVLPSATATPTVTAFPPTHTATALPTATATNPPAATLAAEDIPDADSTETASPAATAAPLNEENVLPDEPSGDG